LIPKAFGFDFELNCIDLNEINRLFEANDLNFEAKIAAAWIFKAKPCNEQHVAWIFMRNQADQ
jgi:hypothetical protein